MRRSDFIKIIKLRSFWKISKKLGNYKLPNGKNLDSYIERLVKEQLTLDKLGIAADGSLQTCTNNNGTYTVYIAYNDNETVDWNIMGNRFENLIADIIGR